MKRKAGRPAIGKRRDVRLSDEHWQLVTDFGDGEAARGLRQAIEYARTHMRAVIRARRRKQAEPPTPRRPD